MSSGTEGPQDGSRPPRQQSNQRRSGGAGTPPGRGAGGSAGNAPGRGASQPRREMRRTPSRTSAQIAARRLEQQQARRRRTMLGAILAAVVVLVAAIAIIVAAVANHGSSAPPATATPPPVPTSSTQASIPPALLVPSTPPAAELAASTTACKPFLAAGQQPKGHNQWGQAPKQVIDASKQYQVKIYTDKGTVTAAILPKLAPITANNFIFLACNGFYNNTIFHRTIPNFMIQGGDPTGTGTGGPGYTISDEKVARAYEIGDLAMANTGQPNSGGSQFFVIQGSQGVSLPQSYSLFGHVTQGQNVVDAIAVAPTHAATAGGENSSPNKPVHIRTITVQVS